MIHILISIMPSSVTHHTLGTHVSYSWQLRAWKRMEFLLPSSLAPRSTTMSWSARPGHGNVIASQSCLEAICTWYRDDSAFISPRLPQQMECESEYTCVWAWNRIRIEAVMERWSVGPLADEDRSKDRLPPPTIAAEQEPIPPPKTRFRRCSPLLP